MTDSLPNSINILVTGATGFIGSHLCQELVRQKYQVFGVSRSGNTQNIKPLLPQKNFHLLLGDIRNEEEILHLMKSSNIDIVFHLAAQLPRADDLNNPFPSFDTNARGTLNLLHAAYLNGIIRFIYSSSIDVYSEPPEYLPVDENHPTRPHTHYGIGKLTGELYANLYSNTIRVTILRYSIVCGKRGKPGGAVSQFIKRAINNEPLTIYGDGEQSNDFVYVGDVVQANLLTLKQDKPEIYNIGSGEETSIKDLAQNIIKLTNSNSEIVFSGEESNRPFRFTLDISRAQKALGYKPSPLSQGLSNISQSFF